MHSGLILVKAPNQIIPKEFFNHKGPKDTKTVLEKHSSVIGAAVWDGNELLVTKLMSSASLDDIMKLQEECRTRTVTIFLGTGQFTDEEDIPPYTLLTDDNDKPTVVAFVEGEFPAYVKKDSSFSEEYHFVQDELIPSLEAIEEKYEGDLEKTYAHVKTLTSAYLDKCNRGTIVFMFGGQERAANMTKSTLAGDFFWGSTNYTCGYKVDSKENFTKTSVPAVKNVLSFLGGDGKGAREDKPKPKEGDIIAAPVVKRGSMSQNQWKQTVRACMGGSLVAEWKSLTEIYDIRKASDVDKQLVLKKFTTLAGPSKDLKDLGDTKKNVEPDHVKPAEVKDEPLPIIPKDQVDKIVGEYLIRPTVVKVMDRKGAERISPHEIQQLESKHPSFCEQVALSGLEETFRISFADLLELCRKYPDAAAVLMSDYRSEYLKTLASKLPDGLTITSKTDDVQTVVEEPKKRKVII